MLESELVYEFLPKKINEWTPNDVELWFHKNQITLKNHFSFQEEKLDGQKLLTITPKYLLEVCGVQSRVLSKKIVEWIENETQQFEEYLNQKIQQTRIQHQKEQKEKEVPMTERRDQLPQNILGKQLENQQEPKSHRQAIRPANMIQELKVQKWKKRKPLFNNEDILITGKSENIDEQNKPKEQKFSFEIPRGAHFIRSSYEQCLYSMQFMYNNEKFMLSESGTIGRQKKSTINIVQECVSRKHAEVIKHNNKFYIKDVGSSYGTYFLLTSNIQLSLNDILIINENEFNISQLKVHKKQNLFSISIKDLQNESIVNQFSSKSVIYVYKKDSLVSFNDKWRGKYIAKILMEEGKVYLCIEEQSTIFRRLKENELYEIGEEEMIIRLGSAAHLQTKLIKSYKPITNVTPQSNGQE